MGYFSPSPVYRSAVCKTPVYLAKNIPGFHINAVAAYSIYIHVYFQSFSIRITSTIGRMWWKWKRQRISLSIEAWWWCLIHLYFMLRTQEILKCDCIHSVWRHVWLTERLHIDLPWSIIVSVTVNTLIRRWRPVKESPPPLNQRVKTFREVNPLQPVGDRSSPLTGWRSSWFRTC